MCSLDGWTGGWLVTPYTEYLDQQNKTKYFLCIRPRLLSRRDLRVVAGEQEEEELEAHNKAIRFEPASSV